MMACMAAYSRSQCSCMLQKLNTIYFKSCGLAAKGFDTLHVLGITMCQKTAYRCIEAISKSSHMSLNADISRYPWFGCHDNVNLGFQVYEQRLSNHDHFDSGTAATIIVIKDPVCKPPNPLAVREMFIHGSRNPISHLNILDLDNSARPRLMKHTIYQVLKVLTHASTFEFDSYFYRDDPIFH
jgi:hypothetical protein